MSRRDMALWAALLLGIIANAAMAGLYAVRPPLYPTAVRTTGMGWAISIRSLWSHTCAARERRAA